MDCVFKGWGHKVRRDTLIIFLIYNVSYMYFGLILLATNFYDLLGTSIKQENQFRNIPLYFISLIIILNIYLIGTN